MSSFLDPNLKFSEGARLKYLVLKALNLIYNILIRLRLCAYRVGLKRKYHPERKVISIGNITVGGTGKTPLVDWILDFCGERKINAAVLTRGYKSGNKSDVLILDKNASNTDGPTKFGDEPWLLSSKHPDARIFVSPDRVAAAKRAEKEHDLLLMDDGMQHLRIHRDLNIVLIDCAAGFGNNHALPLGPLREPLSGLGRADAVVFTKTNLLDTPYDTIEKIQKYLEGDCRQFFSQYLPDHLFSGKDDTQIEVSALINKSCLLFSGIGNPRAFHKTISELGASVVDQLILDDHEAYNADRLEQIKTFAASCHHEFIICTEKDWIKLKSHTDELPEIHVLVMKMDPGEEFEEYLSDWFKTNLEVDA